MALLNEEIERYRNFLKEKKIRVREFRMPSNGGLGPWNLAVMFALELYGVSESSAAAYSVAVWSCQTIMLIMLGIFSAIYIMHTRHFRKVAAQGSGPHT